MHRIGSKIVADKKSMLKHDGKEGMASQDRDLLTLLIKSNLAEAAKDRSGSQSMSDEEVLGRTYSNFVIAFCPLILRGRNLDLSCRRPRNQ
jgi:hypothetical protein